jgi:tetratricopeptide (TPR) repeat protein
MLESAKVLNNQEQARVLFEQGLAYDQQGHFDQAIALDPNDAPAHSNLGAAYAEQGRSDEAIAALQQAIALDPKLALAHSNLGLAYAEQGRYDEAIAALQQAIALDPKLALAHSNLGRAYAEQGRYDEAIAAFQEALTLARRQDLPDFEPEILRRLGLAFWQAAAAAAAAEQRSAHLANAAAAFEQALDLLNILKPDPLRLARLCYQLGFCCHQLGRWQAALERLTEARRIFTEHKARPELARTLLELGQLYHDYQEFDDAYAHLKDALRLFKQLAHYPTSGYSNLFLPRITRIFTKFFPFFVSIRAIRG